MTKRKRYACMPRERLSRGELSITCIQPEHIEWIRRWRNSQVSVLRQNEQIAEQQQVEYYSQYIWPTLDQPQPDNILLALYRNQSLIGYGGLVHIAWRDLRAEISFLVEPALAQTDKEYRLVFLDFLLLVRELAFKDLGFRRLHTECWASRQRHIQIIEEAGFKHEGVLRQHTLQSGVPTDAIIHGLLASDELGFN